MYILTALSLSSCSKEQLVGLPETVSFNEHIRPIFSKNCSSCHGGVKKSGGLSYVFRDEAIAVGHSKNRSIIPGDAEASHLIKKITSTDPLFRMPPPEHGPALSSLQIALMKKWIDQGAHWETHWAFVKPASVEAPPAQPWGHNEVDRFIYQRLKREQLTPQQEANKGALLRRVSLDIIGLPPSMDELDSFLNDDSPDAYKTVVNRLLESPRYGERWATMWLDLARYADSTGLGQDNRRPSMYKFRDWVVKAFNVDMPFDEFTIRQIAGDLLPDATLDDYVATAFHRNTPSEGEGGTSDEEFRVLAQIDRVNTTWQVWHGTTMGCVQCHSHPYDPIRHDEYYEFMDFFNNTQDGDLQNELPVMAVPKGMAQQEAVGAQISELRTTQKRLWDETKERVENSAWSWLKGMSTEVSKPKQMTYSFELVNGREEFVFSGTPVLITQTIRAPFPALSNSVQSIRFEVRPDQYKEAPFKPSPGFRLDSFSVSLVSTNGTKTALELDQVYLDEPFPFLSPRVKGQTGFSALNYIFHDRWAVFRFKKPFTPRPHETIEIVFKHGAATGKKDLLLIRRGAFALSDDPAWRTDTESSKVLQTKLETLKKSMPKGKSDNVLIMVERPEHLRRGTKTFVRGNWTDLGEPQVAGVPAVFHPLPTTDEPKRLQLGRWLVDDQNPLAARVIVCRYWEQLFGTGLVETLEDFGSVGSLPSHPQLLDFLANKLMHDFDWSMKDLLRYIVTSATYKQDNSSTPELNKLDPQNRLLARGPRTQLSGEMVRDQCLAVAGILNEKMYGPSIMPTTPEGGWAPSHNGAGPWTESSTAETYRRSIYIRWQRSSIYPILEAFDAPSRALCSDRRIRTNTPIQPLFTLNDPALFEATQRFSDRMRESKGTLADKIGYGYRLVTSQTASNATIEKLLELHQQVVTLYPQLEASMKVDWDEYIKQKYAKKRAEQSARNKAKINQAKKKKQPPPTDLPDPKLIQPEAKDAFDYSAEQSAFDTVASVMLNLDAVLNK